MSPAGGQLRRSVKARGSITDVGERHVVLLIHGFNVDERAAREGYAAFREHLPPERRSNSAIVLWPGDRFGGVFARVSSGVMYSWMPRRAEDTALKLHRYLSQHHLSRSNGTTHLYIVAHSLGCRVALELARLIDTDGDHRRDRLRLIALMAAAVPLYMVQPGERLNLLEHGGERLRILYSKQDKVLKRMFRLGQFFESSTPTSRFFLRRAMGRSSLNTTFPKSSRISEEDTKLDHGEYWPSYKVARSLAPDLPRSRRLKAGRRLFSGKALHSSRLPS
ncbi:alpha/beta hydrolase [Ruegeria sp. HKCCD6228]|uniref:alpha/beta hydrolase n=1 Tax=Ruegeria sp. HKCCD6228 TaxID=2683001 RepID=UPI00353053E8